MLFRKIILLLTLCCCCLVGAIKQQTEVLPAPASLQAILFSKMFNYVNSIEDVENIKVLVVYDAKSGVPDELVRAFLTERIEAVPVEISSLEAFIELSPIVYVTESLDDKSLKLLSSLNNKLLISGEPKYIEQGIASLGVGAVYEDDDIISKILINISQLKKQNQQVSTQLIDLAEVFK